MNLNQAIKKASEAAQNSNMKYKLGTIIFDNKNFATGYNRKFSVKCETKPTNFSIHAEEMAILRANRFPSFSFKDSTLVIVRINKEGIYQKSYPCKHCQSLIKKYNIKTVYYIS